MNTKHQLVMWILAACAAVALLIAVLVWQNRQARAHWTSFLMGDPHTGGQLFQRKGCARCHSIGGAGAGRSGPDLGFQLQPKSNINQMVTTMWNHAPAMWEKMRAENISYPVLTAEDTAHLFAFLYTARYVDEPGESERGEALFGSKGCARCHALNGEPKKMGPDLSAVSGLDTPIVWTQAMWNHAPAMQKGMRDVGLSWPKFQDKEMNDLLAYIRKTSGGERHESDMLPADPNHGWRVFQDKSCGACHSIKSEGKAIGPELGPGGQLPHTIVQFAGEMWNHSPEMWRQMKVRGISRPAFEGREMADLIAFLYSLRYFEPAGSSVVGASVFARRRCADCHGPRALGGGQGPRLRGRGQDYTSLALAEALWRHGPQMYERVRKLGYAWPVLGDNELGDLVAFLNSPFDESQ